MPVLFVHIHVPRLFNSPKKNTNTRIYQNRRRRKRDRNNAMLQYWFQFPKSFFPIFFGFFIFDLAYHTDYRYFQLYPTFVTLDSWLLFGAQYSSCEITLQLYTVQYKIQKKLDTNNETFYRKPIAGWIYTYFKIPCKKVDKQMSGLRNSKF